MITKLVNKHKYGQSDVAEVTEHAGVKVPEAKLPINEEPKKAKKKQSRKLSKDKVISLRLYDRDYQYLADCAKRLGKKLPDYLREVALAANMSKAEAEQSERQRIIGQIVRIGNNVNQIARAVNTYGVRSTTPIGVEILYQELVKIRKILDRVYYAD